MYVFVIFDMYRNKYDVFIFDSFNFILAIIAFIYIIKGTSKNLGQVFRGSSEKIANLLIYK
jgi:hypothetical protein